jgi:hypothetical protein
MYNYFRQDLANMKFELFSTHIFPPMLKYGNRPCQKGPDTENQGQSLHILVILNKIWVMGDFKFMQLCDSL